MVNKYKKYPELLEALGFKDISPSSTDFVRFILYKKKIDTIDLTILVRLTLYISDDPFATYDENHDISFEDVVLVDSSGNEKLTAMTSIQEIKQFLRLIE